jgi:hypothetical protein
MPKVENIVFSASHFFPSDLMMIDEDTVRMGLSQIRFASLRRRCCLTKIMNNMKLPIPEIKAATSIKFIAKIKVRTMPITKNTA